LIELNAKTAFSREVDIAEMNAHTISGEGFSPTQTTDLKSRVSLEARGIKSNSSLFLPFYSVLHDFKTHYGYL